MTENVIGIIVCVAMVVCGIGSYFIGRVHGMEYVLMRMGELFQFQVVHEEEESQR